MQPGQDVDGRAGEESAQLLGLAEGGDEEGLAAGARKAGATAAMPNP